jgi:hypothetical protein
MVLQLLENMIPRGHTMKTTTRKPTRAAQLKTGAKATTDPTRRRPSPSPGDPEREELLEGEAEWPALDNDTVRRTARPDGSVIPDDDIDDEAQEQQEERDEDVREGNPLHIGHFAGR